MSRGVSQCLLGEGPVDLLVIAPHPDDAEIGLGGTLAQIAKAGHRVGILDLTDGEPTPMGDPERRLQEATEAAKSLGIAFRACLGLPNRSIQHTLEARWELAGWIRRLRPSCVALPFEVDYHPDHVETTRLAEAACFWARLSRSDLPGSPHRVQTILYYYSIHLRMPIQPSVLIDITHTLQQKVEALQCYRSQLDPSLRGPSTPVTVDDLVTVARYWGWLARTGYAEPIYLKTPVLIGDVAGWLLGRH